VCAFSRSYTELACASLPPELFRSLTDLAYSSSIYTDAINHEDVLSIIRSLRSETMHAVDESHNVISGSQGIQNCTVIKDLLKQAAFFTARRPYIVICFSVDHIHKVKLKALMNVRNRQSMIIDTE
jgi:hypothetical protein